MPTYEYTCRSCGHTFDIVQAMSEEAMTLCPECGGELRKVFGAPSISFKGSGFYATDHGKKSKAASDRSTDKTPATSESTSDGGQRDTQKKDKKDAAKPSEKKAASSSEGSSTGGSSSSGGSSSGGSSSGGSSSGESSSSGGSSSGKKTDS